MGRAFEFRKARKMKRWSAMAKTFTRIGKDIVMAVKEGGPDPDNNARLRAVIQNAREANMPLENVNRAIKKATDKDQGDYKEVLFEGKRSTGVQLESGEIIEADDVVLNADYANMMSKIMNGHGKSESAMRGKKYSCSTFMLYLGLDKIYME